MKKAKILIAAAAMTAVPIVASTPSLAAAPANHAAASAYCPPKTLCLYHGANYTGGMQPISKCGRSGRIEIIWSGIGSWVNNQTSGTVGTFYDYHGNVWSRTGPAFDAEPRQDWTSIWAAQAC